MGLVKKADLINEIAGTTGFTKKDVGEVLNALRDVVWVSLREHNEVCVVDSIKLTTKFKDSHEARNPSTGDIVTVPAKYMPKAKFGGAIKDFINK